MHHPSLNIARALIAHSFEWTDRRVWSHTQLEDHLNTHRAAWGLSGSVSTAAFLRFLVAETSMVRCELDFPDPLTRYCWEPCSLLELAISLRPRAFFSHATAAGLHGLSSLSSTIIYTNAEQRATGRTGTAIQQDAVDRVFAKPPRLTRNRALHGDTELVQLEGKNTGEYGVIEREHPYHGPIQLTGLERTLIDIAVRPFYAGGVRAVLLAYAAAAPWLATRSLAQALSALDMAYPYHQVIGFYLERSGAYPEPDLETFEQIPMELDFYLDYETLAPVYSPRWRLYYPSALDEPDPPSSNGS